MSLWPSFPSVCWEKGLLFWSYFCPTSGLTELACRVRLLWSVGQSVLTSPVSQCLCPPSLSFSTIFRLSAYTNFYSAFEILPIPHLVWIMALSLFLKYLVSWRTSLGGMLDHSSIQNLSILMDCPLQFKPQVLNGFLFRSLRAHWNSTGMSRPGSADFLASQLKFIVNVTVATR